MQMLMKLSRMIDAMSEFIGRTALWLVFASAVISAGNAIVRKVFDTSSNALLEIQWYLFAGVFLLASGFTMLRQGHVKIDVVLGRFSKRTQIKVEMFGILFFLMPFVFSVIREVWPLVVNAYESGEMSENAGGLIRWPVYALVPIGFALLGIQGVSEFIKRLGFLLGRCDDPTQPPQLKTAEQELAEEIQKHQVASEVVDRVEDFGDMALRSDTEGERK